MCLRSSGGTSFAPTAELLRGCQCLEVVKLESVLTQISELTTNEHVPAN